MDLVRISRRHLLGAGLTTAQAWSQSEAAGLASSAITSEILLRANSAWDNTAYAAYPRGEPELTVRRITVPAGGELMWHSHPMPSAAYIQSGEITVEEATGARRRFSAGQVIPETIRTLHRAIVGNEPAVFIVFYAGVKGMPLSNQQP